MLLAAVVFAQGAGSPASGAAATAPRPNLVVILCDDMGWGDAPGYGLPGAPPAHGAPMPNLERLAREGARFTDFYAAQPVCTASRAGLLTGCYPNRIGLEGALFPDARIGIADRERTLAELLRDAGYATGIFGKWHLGCLPEFNPVRHGFDEFLGIPYSNDMWPRRIGGSVPPLPMYDGTTVVGHVESMDDQAAMTRRLTERTVDFIRRSAATKRPFLAYLPHPQPHAPIAASAAFAPATRTDLYASVMREIDWSVGEVLRALDEAHVADDTIVIFTSDNGPWLSFGSDAGSSGGLREGKGTTFEGGVREPCFVRWPGHVPAGTVSRVPWMAIDVLPTMAAIVGAAPATRELPIDGRDARAVWSCAPDARPTHDAFLFYYDRNALEAVRMGRWKLCLPHRSRTLDGKPGGTAGSEAPYVYRDLPLALFDLDSDPAEKIDVAAAHPEVVKAIMSEVERARADLGDGLVGRAGSGRRDPGRVPAPSKPMAPPVGK